MGLVMKEDGYAYVSDSGHNYALLEGMSIGGDRCYTSDICFVMDDDSEYYRFVGFFCGATFLTEKENIAYIKRMVDEYEANLEEK